MGFDGLWAALEPVGRAASGGYRRYAWTRVDLELREWFAAEAAARGLDLTTDRAGNLWAWWPADPAAGPGPRPGPETGSGTGPASGTGPGASSTGPGASSTGPGASSPGPGASSAGPGGNGRGGSAGPGGRLRDGVVIGSHLDSVPDGGAYDGPLGVVSALAAVDLLRERGFRPARPVGIAVFGDEEGARFGVACAGSKLLTGALPADRALGLADGDGVTMAEALRAAGRPPVAADPEALARVGVFVELHVEQGIGLAALDRPVGVGSAIWPHGRWRLDLAGEANHAGTTRLADRRDPMLALAAAITAARSAAGARGCLATIGKVAVEPNGVNAIPSHVTAWLDARGPETVPVRDVVAAVAAAAGTAAREESFTGATVFDPPLVARLARALGDAPVLPTGAGHDAGILAAAGVPAGMLFVRNPTGVSHSPAEHAERADCLAGVDALAAVVAELAG